MPKVSQEYRVARRQEILDVAVRCFARDGFHKVSMDTIIKEGDLSAGAIYRYFRSKDEIIAAIAQQRHAQETALLAKFLESEDLAVALPSLAKAFFLLLKSPEEQMRRKVGIQVWAEALRSKQILEILERGIDQRKILTDAFARAQRSGRLSKLVEPDALSRLMLAILQGFILQQAWEPKVKREDFLNAFTFVCKAILAPGEKQDPVQGAARRSHRTRRP